MNAHRALLLFAAAALGAPALGDGYEWLNVEKYPSSLEETAYGWSAIRSETGEISHRVAADDFIVAETTRITLIEFWTVEILINPLLGIDWYIFDGPPEGPPGNLIAHGQTVPTPHEDTGLVNGSFGTLYREAAVVDSVPLEPGHYFLAFRVVQSLPEGEKGIGSLTTIWQNGASRGWWNFGLLADGTVAGQWVPMKTFNDNDHEWAFRITGTGPSCYPDCDGNGVLDLFDFLCFQNAFVGGEEYGDCDVDGAFDLFDFLCFQNEFVGGC